MRTLVLIFIGAACAAWALLIPSRRAAGRLSRRREDVEATLILAVLVALYAAGR